MKKRSHKNRRTQTQKVTRPSAPAKKQDIPSRWPRLSAYGRHHLRACVTSFGQLMRSPFANILTLAVMAIALAQPSGLYVALKNIDVLTASWDEAAQISLFLKRDAANANTLMTALEAIPGVATALQISPDEAMAELEDTTGFGGLLALLPENPLPTVIVVTPAATVNTPDAISALVDTLAVLPGVEQAQLDQEWLNRLFSLLHLGHQAVWLLGLLLGIAVLLVVGNTIRLLIARHQEEIQIMKLVGGTSAFIRRPFLYMGAWYGLLGGLCAWLLVAISLYWLQGPVDKLATLYHTQFHLDGLGIVGGARLLLISVALGMLGARLAIGRHLAKGQ